MSAFEVLNPHDRTVDVVALRGYGRDLAEDSLLAISLSERFTEPNGIAISTICRRYGDRNRLLDLPDWRSFPPVTSAQTYGGSILILRFSPLTLDTVPAISLRPRDDKPQHALIRWPHIWILGVYTLRRYKLELASRSPRLLLEAECDDSWLSGGHTLDLDGEMRLLVSASAGDAVLTLDAESLEILSRWRLPSDVYGSNWDFASSDDLRQHYVPNDFQIGHLNGAAWSDGGFLYSTLSGSIGSVDPMGNHRMLVKGLASSHGIRRSRSQGAHFVDSAAGMIVGLDSEGDGGILWRQALDSRWLHDAIHVGSGVFACALSDRRRLTFIHRDEVSPRATLQLDGAAGTPQFLSIWNPAA